MRFDYSANEEPPAPAFPVRVRHPALRDRSLDLTGKIDTGADLTAIPVSVVAALTLDRTTDMAVAGFDGLPRRVELYAVQLELPTGERSRLNALAVPADYVLLGRDVLNQLRLLLDGPALSLEILPTQPET